MIKIRKPVIDRFMKKFIPVTESGCWLWTGGTAGIGYGVLYLGGERKQGNAHRISWELFRGEIPEGLCVLHKCDIPSCVNPDHLWLGTNKDNQDDMRKKGRFNYKKPDGWSPAIKLHPEIALRGEQRPNFKLTMKIVKEIKELHSKGMRQIDIAKKLGIHQTTVSRATRMTAWK